MNSFANIDANQKTPRAYANQYYEAAGFSFVDDHRQEIDCAGLIVERVPKGLDIKAAAVAEQIGRLLEQDHKSEEDALIVAQYAAAMLNAGFTVKQTASWIRQGRRQGFTKPDIKEAATDIHLTYEEIAKVSLCFDLLRDLLAASQTDRQYKQTTRLTLTVDHHKIDEAEAIRDILDLQRKIDAKLE